MLRPSDVVEKVNISLVSNPITQNLHTTLYKLFEIRPEKNSEDPFETKTEFCLYNETHNDYVYQNAWVEFIVHFMQSSGIDAKELRKKERLGEKLDIEKYRL